LEGLTLALALALARICSVQNKIGPYAGRVEAAGGNGQELKGEGADGKAETLKAES
jgi:uncharacterized protein YciW